MLGDLRVHLLPLPASVHGVLRDALGGGFSHPLPQPHAGSWWKPITLMAVALVAIVAGATAMVDTSLVVADAIGLSHALVGLLVLAVVTSLPNMSTAIRLARQGRGDATVSETLNSNNINLVGGIVIPAAILGLGTVPGGVVQQTRSGSPCSPAARSSRLPCAVGWGVSPASRSSARTSRSWSPTRSSG